MNDRDLASRVLAGDDDAQRLFYEKFEGRLKRTCIHFLGWQDPECEDLVQETFVLAFKGLRGFDQSRDLFQWR